MYIRCVSLVFNSAMTYCRTLRSRLPESVSHRADHPSTSRSPGCGTSRPPQQLDVQVDYLSLDVQPHYQSLDVQLAYRSLGVQLGSIRVDGQIDSTSLDGLRAAEAGSSSWASNSIVLTLAHTARIHRITTHSG